MGYHTAWPVLGTILNILGHIRVKDPVLSHSDTSGKETQHAGSGLFCDSPGASQIPTPSDSIRIFHNPGGHGLLLVRTLYNTDE